MIPDGTLSEAFEWCVAMNGGEWSTGFSAVPIVLQS